MILFSEIFDRAVNLFDDPDIRQNYVINPAGFQKDMRPLLINGLNKWTSPSEITDKLSIYSDAQGKAEIIEGNDIDTYTLESHPVDNAAITFKCNGKCIRGQYIKETNQVIFERPILSSETAMVI